jgi:hemerythrin-like metal-binding protein
MTIPITPWKDEYATGNSLVDEQHQSIFSIVNALSRAMDEGHGEALIEDTIQGVKEYTSIHFDTEEQYMLNQGYPGYELHHKKHEALKAKFDAFSRQQYPDLHERTVLLAHVLTTWLIQHITIDDKKMVDYCRQQEIAEATPHRAPVANAKDLVVAQWRPEYETGYTLIDDQHRSLFHAINALHSAILEGRGADMLERTLTILDHYTTIHFQTEENFMIRFDYPDYADHVKKHQRLRYKVEDFLALKDRHDDASFAIQVSRFLTQWLIHHIREEDLKMITFLRDIRQQQP